MEEIVYSVVVRDFKDASTGDFSPGDVVAFIDNPTNLGWSEYVNEVGEAFWSVSQDDPNTGLLAADESFLNTRPIVQILRNGELVWAGWLGEVDETDTDVVFYAYSYLSGYYDLVMDFDQKWTGKKVSEIVGDAFDEADSKTDSRVGWFTKGTIEAPPTTSGGSTDITLPLYRAPYKRILSVFREMAAYSISDTTNHVIFEVTPSGTFNFWKNRKTTHDDARTSLAGGWLRSFRRIRRPVHRRNQILAVGTSPTTVTLNRSETDTDLRDAMGLSQEPLYFSYVRDSDELSRVAKARLRRAKRTDTDLYLSYHRNVLIPYPATGYTYRLGDIVPARIEHGLSDNITNNKVIMGQQVLWHRQAENVRYLLGDTL